MTYQIGQSFSDKVASIAPVAGLPLVGFNIKPAYPISLLDIHGTRDHYVPANHSEDYSGWHVAPYQATLSADGMYYTPLHNVTQIWAETDGCSVLNQNQFKVNKMAHNSTFPMAQDTTRCNSDRAERGGEAAACVCARTRVC